MYLWQEAQADEEPTINSKETPSTPQLLLLGQKEHPRDTMFILLVYP